jgi:hypothetical protein
MRKRLLCFASFVMLSNLASAQITETFEGITASGNAKPTVFVSNGQSFTITTNDCTNGGTFGVWIPSQQYLNCNGSTTSSNGVSTAYGVGTACTGGNCTGTSSKFIDNGVSSGVSQIYSIKTTNGSLFTVKSMFVYLSSDQSITPSAAGGITVRGRIGGITVFTYSKTTGFNSSFGSNNGFTYLDFSSGTDYTIVNIDELQVQGGNTANYVAIDNFRWGSNVALPLGLESFYAQQNGNKIDLNWNASKESTVVEYQVERSGDGKQFSAIYNMAGNASGKYIFNDMNPIAGNNFYRLKMIYRNAASEYSDVRNVFFNGKQALAVYPNPTKGLLFMDISGTTLLNIQITDLTGRVIETAKLSVASNAMNIEKLKSGIYFYKAVDAVSGQVLGSGKISKI